MAVVYSVTVIAFLVCIISTPFVIEMCKKHGLVDVPKIAEEYIQNLCQEQVELQYLHHQ